MGPDLEKQLQGKSGGIEGRPEIGGSGGQLQLQSFWWTDFSTSAGRRVGRSGFSGAGQISFQPFLKLEPRHQQLVPEPAARVVESEYSRFFFVSGPGKKIATVKLQGEIGIFEQVSGQN